MNLITDTTWGRESKPARRQWRKRRRPRRPWGEKNKRPHVTRQRVRRAGGGRSSRKMPALTLSNRGVWRALATVAAVAVVAVVIVFAVLSANGTGNNDSRDSARPGNGLGASAPAAEEPVQSVSAAPFPSPAARGGQCVDGSENGVIIGAGAGDQRSGPGAILAFDFAFYVKRDAVAVRSVAPNAVAAEDVLQRAINTTPPGTTHCLRIAERGRDQYSVELSLYKPDGTVWKVYSQIITTAYRDGKFWVERVRSAT